MSFSDEYEEVEKKYPSGGGSDKFSFKEGDNRFRILTKPVTYITIGDNGKEKANWLTYVLDCRPGTEPEIRLWFMPKWIAKWIAALGKDSDYAFSEFPMPYDLKVHADDKVGTKDVEYDSMPSPKREYVSESVLKKLAEIIELKPLQQIADKTAAKMAPKVATEPVARELKPGETSNMATAIRSSLSSADTAEKVQKVMEMLKLSTGSLSGEEVLSLRKNINSKLEFFGEIIIDNDDLPF